MQKHKCIDTTPHCILYQFYCTVHVYQSRYGERCLSWRSPIHGTNLSIIITSSGIQLSLQISANNGCIRNQMFDNLVCDLKDPDKIAQLCNLLRQFQHMFIQEYVELCPYRLSLVSPYRLSLGGREFLGEFKNYCDRFSKKITQTEE